MPITSSLSHAADVDCDRAPRMREVPRLNRMLLRAVLALVAGSSAPSVLAAQTIDALVQLLDSPDWRVRSDAVSRLNLMPLSDLPATVAPKLTALLEREALQPDLPANVESEGYGEYEIELVHGVLRFRDPASLRGMALLGIHTSREAQEFVASHGAASLPYLDQAWATQPLARGSVVTTWALMLGRFAHTLSRDERLQIQARLLAADAINFAWAAVTVPMPEAVPILEATAAADPLEIVRNRAQTALTQLRPLRDALSSQDLAARLREWLDALCSAAQGARRGTCESLTNLLDDVRTHLAAGRTGSAKNAFEAFANRADSAMQQGELTDAEHRLLADNARYLAGKL